jgi:hypothetical protein
LEILECENRELRTTVNELLIEGKKMKEEQKVATATQVVTPPTTPWKEFSIGPAPPKASTHVVTLLAQELLKRNMAQRKKQSGSEAMEIDDENNLAPTIGRPSKASRQLSPTTSFMHSRHTQGVDKEEQIDKGGKDKQREVRKPK